MTSTLRGVLSCFLLAGVLTACSPSDAPKTARSGQVVTSGSAQIGGPFTLIDATGATVTEAALTGKPHLVYFGFTSCPDVCPTSLQRMGAAQQLMGAAGDDVGWVLVSVDPERDTPEKLAEYIGFDVFPDGLRGFTGTVEQVNAAKAAYRVYAEKAELGDSAMGYTVDHTDFIYLLDKSGTFAALFKPDDSPQDIAVRVRQELMKG